MGDYLKKTLFIPFLLWEFSKPLRFGAFCWEPFTLLLLWARETPLSRTFKVYIFSFAKSAHYTDTFSTKAA